MSTITAELYSLGKRYFVFINRQKNQYFVLGATITINLFSLTKIHFKQWNAFLVFHVGMKVVNIAEKIHIPR